jgi:hypothetical protein
MISHKKTIPALTGHKPVGAKTSREPFPAQQSSPRCRVMSVGGFIATMFLVVSVILLGLEWLSRASAPPSGGDEARRQQVRRRPPR